MGQKGTLCHTAEALYYSLSRALGGGLPVNFTLRHLQPSGGPSRMCCPQRLGPAGLGRPRMQLKVSHRISLTPTPSATVLSPPGARGPSDPLVPELGNPEAARQRS